MSIFREGSGSERGFALVEATIILLVLVIFSGIMRGPYFDHITPDSGDASPS